MGILYAWQLGLSLLVLTRVFFHVRTVRLVPIAISEKAAMEVALKRRAGMNFSEIRSEYR
jgi:hypothetical protein